MSNGVSMKSRMGHCEVCNDTLAKYTCPECEVKTCSLPCVKIHKKELECSGIRNRVKFKPLKKFSDIDFQSDYMLLEEATRATDIGKKIGNTLKNSTSYSLPRMKIRTATHKRNIQLYYLPKTFTRHKTNTTFYDWKKDKIFWKVEWVFPTCDVSFVDARVPETEQLIVALKKYVDPEECEENVKKVLSEFHEELKSKEISVLLKGERMPDKFYLVDKDETLMENLSNKKIIENPIFYVVFSDSLSEYGVKHSEGKLDKERYSHNYKGSNLLFDNGIVAEKNNELFEDV